MYAESIRVRGTVQGVGFRPTAWRLAREIGLLGDVRNDGEGVLLRLWGKVEQIDAFCSRLIADPPPLARIDAIERQPLGASTPPAEFRIEGSTGGEVSTGVAADAATCAACLAEVFDPANRRYRYPFTNCTHCGPRLSITRAIPYDRGNTSMSVFPMCALCRAEYQDPADRRFHAQPNACPECGPRAWLEDAAGRELDPQAMGARDAVAAAARLLAQGQIVAVKGIGGFHLACDATDAAAVARLRARKQRVDKPFALMVRDLGVLQLYAEVTAQEAAMLRSAAAPVLLLPTTGAGAALPQAIAPGQSALGFMLPYSPLHALLLESFSTPLVMTSGNRSDEPQCIGNAEAAARLAGIADYCLLHDRGIENRVDDSVLRLLDGAPRLLRRARGFAPGEVPLQADFAGAVPLLALGGELKNTVCLLRAGRAVVSQHLGDLENLATAEAFERSIDLYRALYRLDPRLLVADLHPDYRSTQFAREWSAREGIECLQVQHHHAHVASVLAEHGRGPQSAPVLGVVLDGLGYGEDGSLWGGEFLVADFRRCRRAGQLRAAAMPGGTRAILEPWRNTFAQLEECLGWEAFAARWGGLELCRWLQARPLATLQGMLRSGTNSPRSSSCGRLFDAVTAALGVCREGISYEGQAAIELESLALRSTADGAYAFGVSAQAGLWILDPAPMWVELLADLERGEARERMAARFHAGLAVGVADLALDIAAADGLEIAALTGGVFQNRVLLEQVAARLRRGGLEVLLPRLVPANDAGLSLGQAAIGAARPGTD